MELLARFKEYLFSQEVKPSKVTVKNYLSDVNHFTRWYESHYQKPFTPQLVTHGTIEAYKKEVSSISYDVSGENEYKIPNTKYQILSPRSMERHLSSLRKFFKFLKLEGLTSDDPFEMLNDKSQMVNADPYRLKDFKNYLYVYNASHLTIKNYIIDIKQFLKWAQEVTTSTSNVAEANVTAAQETLGTNETYDLSANNLFAHISGNLLEEYKQRLLAPRSLLDPRSLSEVGGEVGFSPSTVNRKLSSLRKYLSWAEAEGLIRQQAEISNLASLASQGEALRSYGQNLELNRNTGKNVRLELEGFTSQESKATSEVPVSNRQSSIVNRQSYSGFPPIRLFQKISEIGVFAFDQFLTLPFIKVFDKVSYLTWLAKGKPVFKKVSGISYNVSRIKSARSLSVDNILNTKYKIQNTTPKVKNLPKEFYAPLEISTKYFPWYKKVWFTLRYKRPKWYATYHSYAITHYFHFAVLIIFMAVIGFGFYQSFFQKPTTGQPALAAGLPNAPLHILSFQGRLTDNQDNPISTSSAMRFAIYNAQAPASGSALLWQEVNSVSPDQDGIFSVLLGNVTAIPQWLFASNSALFLGVTVNVTPELTPRQQLATVAFAANSELLQGLPPIVQANAGTTNVILALDSSGNLTIGGTANPTFQASGGQFTISGQPLLLTTNVGSNGNIQLAPEGLGKIDLTKPLQNTSISNNIATARGAVEVNDLFAILATSSGQSAFTLNQDSTGPLISASASGVAKFTVGNTGSLTSANYTNAGGILYTSTTGLIGQTAIGISSQCLIGGTTPSWSLCSAASSNYWQRNSGALAPLNITDDLLIGGIATSTAQFSVSNIAKNQAVASLSGNLIVMPNNGWGGNVGIGTTTPGYKLSVVGQTEINRAVGTSADLLFTGYGGLGGIGAASGQIRLFRPDGNLSIIIDDGSTNVYSGTFNVGTSAQFSVSAAGAITAATGIASSGTINFSGLSASSAVYTDGSKNLTSTAPGSGTIGYWQRTLGSLAPTNITDSLNLGATATSSALVHLAGTAGENSWINTGNVGIGTTDPGALLDVQQAANATGAFRTRALDGVTSAGSGIALGASAAQTPFIGFRVSDQSERFNISMASVNTASERLTFSSTCGGGCGVTEWMNINKLGNVGIGTTSPLVTLDVAGAASVGGQLTFRSGTAQIQSTVNQGLTIGGNTTGNITLSPGNSVLGSNVTPGITNQVDLGTAALSWRNIYAQNFIGGTTGIQGLWQRTLGSLAPTNITDSLNLGAVATSSALVHLAGTAGENSFINTGNVGIGTTSPGANLDIATAKNPSLILENTVGTGGGSAYIYLKGMVNGAGPYTSTITGGFYGALDFATANNTGSNAYMTFSPAGAEAMRILTNGNVGIGTTSPLVTLDVAGAASVGGQLTFRSGTAQIQSTVNQGLTIGGNTTGNITLSPGNSVLGSNVTPGITNQVDLGTAALSWRNIYAQNFIGGTSGIQGLWQRTLGSIAPTNITDSINIGSTATSSALVHLAGTAGENSFINTGNFGIGTTSLTEKLHVNGNAVIGNTALGGTVSDSSPFTFSTAADAANNTTSALYIGPTTSNYHRIYFGSSASNSVYDVDFRYVNQGIGMINLISGVSGQALRFNQAQDGVYGVNTFDFYPNISDAKPAVLNNSRVVDGSTAVGFVLKTTNTLSNASAKFLNFDNGSTNLLTVMGSGSFGIGTTSPLATLDVRGNSGTTPAASVSAQTSFAAMVVDNKGVGDIFTASSSGLNRFVIKQSGNVGIGTTTPTTNLDVVGSASISANLAFNGTGTNNIYMLNNSSLAFVKSVGGTAAGAPALGSDIGTFSTTSQAQLAVVNWIYSSNLVTQSGTSYVYVLGGYNNTSTFSSVYKATINTSGDITGTFSTASQAQLPQTLRGHSSETATVGGTNYIYVLGGINGGDGLRKSTVYKATINTSGDITGTFSTASQAQLPVILDHFGSQAAEIGGTSYIYVLGGTTGAADVSTVYKATINTSGNIGTFSTASQGQLPVAIDEIKVTSATIGGTTYVYVIGGNTSALVSTVYKATINTSGDIGTFSTASQAQLPQALESVAPFTTTIDGTAYIYVLGGLNATVRVSTVYKATINSSGDITGSFSTTGQAQLPQALEEHIAHTLTVGNSTYTYVLGGSPVAGTVVSTVYKATMTGGSSAPEPDTVLTIENSGAITIGDRDAQSASAWATARNDAAYEKAESLAVYNGYLYAGFGISAGDGDIYYTSDGSTWTASYTSATFTAFKAMTVYNGKLYAAGSDATNAIVYVCTPSTAGNANICDDNTDWAASYTDAAGHDTALSLAVFNGKLYAGLGSGADDGDVFEFNGTSWAASLSQAGYETISSMAVFNGSLYAGHGNNTAGDADVKRFDGTAWSATFAYTDSATYMEVRSLTVYNGNLYMGTGATTADFGDVYVCDPSAAGATGDWLVCDANADWDINLSTDAFNAAQNIPSMAVYNGKLYAGLSGAAAGDDGDIWVLNGSNWSISQANTGYDSVPSLIEYNGKLFAGLGTDTGDGDIQTYTEARSTTYPLKFAVGSGTSEIAGDLWFDKEDLYGTWGGQGANVGVFKLSHALISNAGAYDIAEDYPTRDDSLKPGNIVSIDANEKGFIKKTSKPYDKNIVGVFSNKPGIRLSQTEQTIAGGSVIPVALVGRVPVSVSTENGPIKPGDYLTSSSIPGAAMKATQPGEVIGKALEGFSCENPVSSISNLVSSESGTLNTKYNIQNTNSAAANFGLVAPSQNYCTGNIVVFINVGYNDPTPPVIVGIENLKDYTFTKLASQGDALRSYAYQVTDAFGNTVTRAEVLAGAVIGNLKAGVINTSQLFADVIQTNIINANKIISPIAQIDTIHTNLISPIGSDSNITLKFDDNKLSILNGNSASRSAVATIDNQGNVYTEGSISARSASFSGSLAANNLAIDNNATISGTLRARKIIADQIEGFNPSVITNVTNVYNSTQSATPDVSGISYLVSSTSGIQNTNYNIQNTGYIDIASYSSRFAYIDNLNTNTATFTNGLMSFGPTSLSDTSVAGQLSIDGNLILASNSINVLGGDLQIQPLRQGGLSVMAGLFYIDTSGNIKVGGDAEFAKDVKIAGTLSANVISPIPGNDLTFKLASSNQQLATSSSGILNTKYKIQNTNGLDVLSVNQLGDLTASGTATFGKLNLNLVSPAFALSTTESIATGSAGTASIRARQTELTINNPLVTDKSLIYITPKSNQIIYLMRQVPGVSFTVGIQNSSVIDIPFNWIIVN